MAEPFDPFQDHCLECRGARVFRWGPPPAPDPDVTFTFDVSGQRVQVTVDGYGNVLAHAAAPIQVGDASEGTPPQASSEEA